MGSSIVGAMEWTLGKLNGSKKGVIKELNELNYTNLELEGDQMCRNPTLAKCGGEAQHLEKVRSWSPPGLPNVQSSIARPKTPRIGVFLVSLERS